MNAFQWLDVVSAIALLSNIPIWLITLRFVKRAEFNRGVDWALSTMREWMQAHPEIKCRVALDHLFVGPVKGIDDDKEN